MTNFVEPVEVPISTNIEVVENNTPPSENPEIPRGGKKLRVAVLGKGIHAEQIRATVNTDRTESKEFDNIDALVEYEPNITFIVGRIPVKNNDTLDDAQLLDAILKIFNNTKSGVCLKSTVNPETADRITDILQTMGNTRFVYSPYTSESDGVMSEMNESTVIIGGDETARRTHVNVLDVHFHGTASIFVPMNFKDAVIYKMALSGFTAIKQSFFAQLAQVADDFDVPMNRVRRALQNNALVSSPSYCIPPIIRSQTDENISLKMARGFGGEYLNDDVRAFCGVTDKMTLLEEAVNWSNVK